MQTVRTSETSANFYLTTRWRIPEVISLHDHRCISNVNIFQQVLVGFYLLPSLYCYILHESFLSLIPCRQSDGVHERTHFTRYRHICSAVRTKCIWQLLNVFSTRNNVVRKYKLLSLAFCWLKLKKKGGKRESGGERHKPRLVVKKKERSDLSGLLAPLLLKVPTWFDGCTGAKRTASW